MTRSTQNRPFVAKTLESLRTMKSMKTLESPETEDADHTPVAMIIIVFSYSVFSVTPVYSVIQSLGSTSCGHTNSS